MLVCWLCSAICCFNKSNFLACRMGHSSSLLSIDLATYTPCTRCRLWLAMKIYMAGSRRFRLRRALPCMNIESPVQESWRGFRQIVEIRETNQTSASQTFTRAGERDHIPRRTDMQPHRRLELAAAGIQLCRSCYYQRHTWFQVSRIQYNYSVLGKFRITNLQNYCVPTIA